MCVGYCRLAAGQWRGVLAGQVREFAPASPLQMPQNNKPRLSLVNMNIFIGEKGGREMLDPWRSFLFENMRS